MISISWLRYVQVKQRPRTSYFPFSSLRSRQWQGTPRKAPKPLGLAHYCLSWTSTKPIDPSLCTLTTSNLSSASFNNRLNSLSVLCFAFNTTIIPMSSWRNPLSSNLVLSPNLGSTVSLISSGVPGLHFSNRWVSSVFPSKTQPGEDLSPAYWRKNLELPVLFCSVIEKLVKDLSVRVNYLIEIGLHPALGGPLR